MIKLYKYKGFFFEWHRYIGPVPLEKNGETSKKNPKGFIDVIEEFSRLTDDEKNKYRVEK